MFTPCVLGPFFVICVVNNWMPYEMTYSWNNTRHHKIMNSNNGKCQWSPRRHQHRKWWFLRNMPFHIYAIACMNCIGQTGLGTRNQTYIICVVTISTTRHQLYGLFYSHCGGSTNGLVLGRDQIMETTVSFGATQSLWHHRCERRECDDLIKNKKRFFNGAAKLAKDQGVSVPSRSDMLLHDCSSHRKGASVPSESAN